MIVQVATSEASWRDYLEICKPRIVLLMLLCAVVGMLLAEPSVPPWQTLLFGTLGIAMVAGSAGAVNHIADARIDAHMARTLDRPLVQGRLSTTRAVLFAAVLGILGLVVLAIHTNALTVWLNFASWLGYGLFYTLFLKRTTSQNIVIGGLFGATPPLLGWTAVTGSIEPGGLLLTLIIFLWTPPHFWALALHRKEEYSHAGIPVLPVTHGEKLTKHYIFLYTALLFPMSLWPFAVSISGWPYFIGALILGGIFLYRTLVLMIAADDEEPMRTFRYSIVYLGLLFALLLADHYLVPSPAG